MQLSLDQGTGHQIQAYEPGQVQIDGLSYTASLIVSPTQLITAWQPKHIDELSEQDCQIIAELNPTLVILGSGDQHLFPPINIFTYFRKQGIGLDVMSTHAACRTYSVLTAEQRNVVAGLIL